MTHIPQCDCSECVTYRLHARLPPRAEMAAEASKISIQPKQETVPPKTDYELSKDALIAHLGKETRKLERYEKFDALLSEIKALHDSKGADYEGSGVPYANLRASEEWGVPAWVYAMLRCEEKMRRLKTYAKGSTLQHEGARDSQIDIAVLALISIVLREDAGL